jgi:hypothetical protein
MLAQICALESAHAKFKQQISEVLHTSQTSQQSLQQNTLVLSNLSTMVSIMMEKIGNPWTSSKPKSPTPQNAKSLMPSLDPMLNSCAGTEEDTPPRKATRW